MFFELVLLLPLVRVFVIGYYTTSVEFLQFVSIIPAATVSTTLVIMTDSVIPIVTTTSALIVKSIALLPLRAHEL